MATPKRKRKKTCERYGSVWLRRPVWDRLKVLMQKDVRTRASDQVAWLIEEEFKRRKDGKDGGRLDQATDSPS